MVNQHYRWDFIGLSTDTKPTPETSEKVTDGSTFYTSDDSKLYVWYKDQWYEKEDTGGGGGGGGEGIKTLTEADYNYPADNPTSVALWLLPAGVYRVADPDNDQVKIATNIDNYGTNGVKSALFVVLYSNPTSVAEYVYILGYAVREHGFARLWTVSRANGFHIGNFNLLAPINSTGTSQTAPMTQNATTGMVFADPGTNSKVRIGNTSNVGNNTICIGNGATGGGANNVAIGGTIESGVYTSVSIGAGASATTNFQEVAIGNNASCSGRGGIAIGSTSGVTAGRGVAIGENARATYDGSVALGSNSSVSHIGEVNIGTSSSTQGYNGNSTYRLLTGLYDPQSAHDAVTKGYVDDLISAIEARLTAGGL